MVALAAQPKLDFQPVRDFILVKPLPVEDVETAAGLIIPNGEFGEESPQAPVPQKAIVVAVGPGRPHDVVDGATIPMVCEKGDVIYIGSKYMHLTSLYLAGEEYLLTRDRDVIAKAATTAD